LSPNTVETCFPNWRLGDLTEFFARVCGDFAVELKDCSGQDDHVPLPAVYPPKLTVSKLLNSLERVSSRLLREARRKITGRYEDGVLWSPCHFASSAHARGYCRVHPQPTRGRASSPPRGTGFGRGSLR